MIRFWSHEAFAHGAEVVSYFRGRQAPFGQEQMHAGLNLPNGEPDQAYSEAAQVIQELAGLNLSTGAKAKVALVFDYEAAWALRILPQGDTFDYLEVVLSFYRAFRRLGLNVDIIPQSAPLEPYRVVAIPPLPIVQPELVESLKRFDGQVLIAPRTGSKTKDFQIPQELPPGGFQELVPLTIWRVESLPGFAPLPVLWNSAQYQGHGWLEHVRTSLPPFARLANGQGAAFRHGKIHYLAILPGQDFVNDLIEELAKAEDLKTRVLPPDIRSRERAGLQYFFNYGPEPVLLDFPATTKFRLGGPELPVAGMTVIELEAERPGKI